MIRVGSSFRVSVFVGGQWLPLSGERVSSLAIGSEIVDTTTKSDGPWRHQSASQDSDSVVVPPVVLPDGSMWAIDPALFVDVLPFVPRHLPTRLITGATIV